MSPTIRRATYLLATAGCAGYFPIAPGTAGSAIGLAVDRGLRGLVPSWLHLAGIVLLAAAGVVTGGVVEGETRERDPSIVVIDELCGMMLGLFLIPASALGLAVGFVLFRLLDVVKPPPCRSAERLPGGWGIMADDLIAGLYTNLLLRVASLWWPALLAHAALQT